MRLNKLKIQLEKTKGRIENTRLKLEKLELYKRLLNINIKSFEDHEPPGDIYTPLSDWTERQKYILDNRINATKKMTYKEIGKKFNVGAAAIRCTERRMIRALEFNEILEESKKIDLNSMDNLILNEECEPPFYGYIIIYWFNSYFERISCDEIKINRLFKPQNSVYCANKIKKMRNAGWPVKNNLEGLEFFLKIAIAQKKFTYQDHRLQRLSA